MEAIASAYTIDDQQRMSLASNYFAWQAELVKPVLGRRVIEAGCGIGNFTRELLDRELVIALDADPACVEILERNFPSVRAFHMDAASAQFRTLRRFRPDSCIFLNVLEHVEDDRAALQNAASVVEPSGAVVLLVPAFPALYGPIDRNLGHYRRYTRKSIYALANSAGLQVERFRYVNFAGLFGWWMNSHVFKREEQSETQIRVFDRCVVPIMRHLERWVPPLAGQSIFAVLRKP